MTHLDHPAPMPVITTGLVADLSRDRQVVDPATGEIVNLADATDDAVVAWRVALDRLATLCRSYRDAIDTELVARTSAAGGPLRTEYGTATQSVSRAAVSGTCAETIRTILENAARLGDIPADAVDNVAPLKAHVTPMRLVRWVADNRHRLAEHDYHDLLNAFPQERRTVKVES